MEIIYKVPRRKKKTFLMFPLKIWFGILVLIIMSILLKLIIN